MIESKTTPPWSWAQLGIVDPEPVPVQRTIELEFDSDDGLGVFHGLWSAFKLTLALGLFVWIVVEFCRHI